MSSPVVPAPPYPQDHGHSVAGRLRDPGDRLAWWQHGWRLGLAWVFGLFCFLFVFLLSPPGRGESAYPVSVDGWLVLDLALGHLALLVVVFRRRWPAAVAVLTMLVTAVSATAIPPALLAATSLATRRRLAPSLAVGAISVLGSLAFEVVVSPRMGLPDLATDLENRLLFLGITLLVTALIYGIFVLVGWNAGVRRELVRSWRTEAETANREQSARVAQAQLAERSRIAREMHDVLAHRLSLVAMHAGVLAHRSDLPEEERREAAEVVRAGAHQALEELREVLGVLRADVQEAPGTDRPEAPQPGLSGIPSLVAEVTSSGQEVHLTADPDLWPRSLSLPTSTGRHAYRIVQEALTNARKHATGAAATVDIGGRPGEGLSIVVANPVRPVAEGTLPSGGRGLTGMAERVQLAGGRFEAGVEVTHFVVRVWLPWVEQGGRG